VLGAGVVVSVPFSAGVVVTTVLHESAISLSYPSRGRAVLVLAQGVSGCADAPVFLSLVEFVEADVVERSASERNSIHRFQEVSAFLWVPVVTPSPVLSANLD
jgi:hypothetical protein